MKDNHTMKNTNYIVLILVSLLFSCQQKPHYIINGVFEEGKGKTILLEDISDVTSIKIIDSSLVDNNGKFKFEGASFGEIKEAKLSIPDSDIKEDLLIEDTIINVKIVTNPATNLNQNKRLKFTFVIDRSKEDKLYLKLKDNYQTRRTQWGIMTNKSVVANREKQITDDELVEARKKLDDEFNNDIIDTLALYPNNYATAFYIKNYMLRYDPLPVVEKAFNAVSEPIKSSNVGLLIKSGIDEIKRSFVGGTPEDFSIPGLDGSPVTLYQYRGKVLLIDCWATWCGPCINAMPHIGEVYKKYHPKGLEVLGISYDGDEEKWRDFLKKNDYIVWDQASSLKEWRCPTAKIFAVTMIPETILFDKNGVIVARGLRGAELEAKIEEVLSE